MAEDSTDGPDGYVPQPLETSNIELIGPLADLSERLAEHVHDVWAKQRLAEGWVWGPERSDRKKTNPTIVRYRDLPDAEKDYDRRTAGETLKAIVALGFSVVPPEAADRDETGESVLAAIGQARSADTVRRLWTARQEAVWRLDERLYCGCAEALCQQGDPLLAYDVCSEGLQWFPANPRLRQLEAWALAQTGATETARARLETLAAAAGDSPETMGLLGRTWKDCAARETCAEGRRRCLVTAFDHYRAGFEHSQRCGSPDFYPAINCAALQMQLGAASDSRMWATRAIEIAAQQTDNPWAEATLAEGHLLLAEKHAAEEHYRKFGRLFAGRRAALASARRQARMLLEVMGEWDTEWLEACLPANPVCLVPAGSRSVPLDGQAGPMVVCPLVETDGAMIDALFESRAEVHVILPLAPEFMVHSSIFDRQRLQRWAEQASHILVAHPGAIRVTDELAQYCALLQSGYARDLARTLVCRLGDVQLPPINRECYPAYRETLVACHGGEKPAITGQPEPVAVAFADVVGYGTLNEDEVTVFQREVLAELQRYLEGLSTVPLFVQTWGDALYLGYASVRTGGLGALALQQFFADFPWHARGFSRALQLRMGLHTGPVLDLQDPFSGMRYFSGTTISRAARIEPLADEGQIFCSSAFAAVASAQGVDAFSLVFAGTHTLPKNAGYERFYRLILVSS